MGSGEGEGEGKSGSCGRRDKIQSIYIPSLLSTSVAIR